MSSEIITSNLSNDSAYSFTISTHSRYASIEDKSSPEAEECRRHLQWWERRNAEFGDFLKDRGKRYESCVFGNYQVSNKAQERVIEHLKAYALSAKESVEAGRNVLLLGPKGTGKDHLLVALAKACFMQTGVLTEWRNGIELLDQFHRDALHGTERFHDPLHTSEILYVSDPVPPTGALSESKQSAMFKLVDNRYRHQKPIWMSLNVANNAEAEQRMGPQTVDRLKDGALILFCNWPSFRKGEVAK